MDRGQQRDDEVRIAIRAGADIVAARQAARELAARLGISSTDLTILATAVSELTAAGSLPDSPRYPSGAQPQLGMVQIALATDEDARARVA